jgi:hypothetical protein
MLHKGIIQERQLEGDLWDVEQNNSREDGVIRTSEQQEKMDERV